MCRRILLVLAVLAVVALAPALAVPPTAAAAPQPAAAQGACAPSLEILAPGAEAVCKPAAPSTTTPAPEFMSITYHGHCRCGCSSKPDCNTSADCGGASCLGGITCC